MPEAERKLNYLSYFLNSSIHIINIYGARFTFSRRIIEGIGLS